MTLGSVDRNVRRLRAGFDRFQELPDDPEVRSHWARYLCILTAALLETSVKEIMEEYIRRNADERVRRRFTSRQEWVHNPRRSEIKGVLRSFDEAWGARIDTFLSGPCGDHVDSVMNNRDNIAHGRDVPLGPAEMERYFNGVVEVIKRVDAIVLGGP